LVIVVDSISFQLPITQLPISAGHLLEQKVLEHLLLVASRTEVGEGFRPRARLLHLLLLELHVEAVGGRHEEAATQREGVEGLELEEAQLVVHVQVGAAGAVAAREAGGVVGATRARVHEGLNVHA